jgi:hypothetical protein
MGGCAPYFSRLGMLGSYTNTMSILPIGGPYSPLRRLSSRPSTCRSAVGVRVWVRVRAKVTVRVWVRVRD